MLDCTPDKLHEFWGVPLGFQTGEGVMFIIIDEDEVSELVLIDYKCRIIFFGQKDIIFRSDVSGRSFKDRCQKGAGHAVID